MNKTLFVREQADWKLCLVNEYRTARVAEVLADFRTLQYYIVSAPAEPSNAEDYYTEGWAALRQCAIDGQYILECAADTKVPVTNGGEAEQAKAELKQCVISVPDNSSWWGFQSERFHWNRHASRNIELTKTRIGE